MSFIYSSFVLVSRKMATVTAESLKKAIEERIPGVTFTLVRDESGGCGSSFFVIVISTSFEGQGLLDRQRTVNEAIKKEMSTIHALQLKTWTPSQWEGKKKEFLKE
eukprot:TRINITY_DN613_c0_g1_i2.p2 TRINITY_DN613_c0_g1~~TRINITY_DN613_c0_g1_i2.p2  ORF type:complete len:106 (-),score=4.71 TRINITY_DN613_c0_g1_i2:167-484(-)